MLKGLAGGHIKEPEIKIKGKWPTWRNGWEDITETRSVVEDEKREYSYVMDWISMSLQNSHVEALTPNMIVFEGGAFRRYLGLDEVMGVRPPWWDYCPYRKRKRNHSSLSPPGEPIVRRWPSASQEEGSHWGPNLLALDLGLFSLQKCEI